MILEYICPNPDCETDLSVPELLDRFTMRPALTQEDFQKQLRE